MGRQAVVALYVLALVAVVVGVDVLFFRDHFWERLLVNVGIVLVFAAFGQVPETDVAAGELLVAVSQQGDLSAIRAARTSGRRFVASIHRRYPLR